MARDDPDYTFQQNMYNEIVYQYVRYVNHVLLNIGGIYLNDDMMEMNYRVTR